MKPIGHIGFVLRANWRYIVTWGVVFTLVFQVAMLISLIVRFQDIPNYITFYNWPGNVLWIIQSTPAWSDMPSIIAEEWLVEIGYMNYDYGVGLSEWSLNVVPSRMLVLFVLGAAIALALKLMVAVCVTGAGGTTIRATTGLGAVLVGMTNVTLSWVVCCATPSWVVGLAMLGLGVSTSLALETMGPPLMIGGFTLLLAMIYILAWRATRAVKPTAMEASHA